MSEGEEPNPNFWKKPRFRAIFLHIGLMVTCIGYIVIGAYLFQSIERPIELEMNKEAVSVFNKINSEFLSRIKESDQNVEEMVDTYIENILLLFENSHYAHVFETRFANLSTDKDIWTFPAAVLFATTTIIPVGYGYVCPSSELGKVLLIVYGIVGIPLALVTVANIGKFLSRIVSVWLNESMSLPTGLFLSLLFFYPIFGGLLFHSYADLSLQDAIYFSFTSIFTIGFGDLMPNVNVVYLVVFIIIGVLLVTITIDFIVAEAIDYVHYMGRHVGKARMIVSKMVKVGASFFLVQHTKHRFTLNDL
uniref:Ion channel n=1 Tax=Angiostrongylus cantonensis TaxID=6313 RepID=A0A158P5Y6_ANGCA